MSLPVAGCTKAPQAPATVLPQLTDQVTPSLKESLFTSAANLTWASVNIDEGGAEVVLKATEIGGGGAMIFFELPQAASAAIVARAVRRKIGRRILTTQPGSAAV